MRHLATAAQMRETDRRAIHEWGIPSTLLMERAAQGIFDAVQELAEERPAFLLTVQYEGDRLVRAVLDGRPLPLPYI